MRRLKVLGTQFEDEKRRYAMIERNASSICLVRTVSKLNSHVSYAVGHVVVRGKVTDGEGREYAAREVFETYHPYRAEGEAREAYQDVLLQAEREARVA